MATGSRRRELESAPDGSFGGDVTYLVEPHLARFAGLPMAVFGGGDSAVLDALTLTEAGSPVTLVHRSPHLTARRDLVDRTLSDSRITDLAGWSLDRLVGSDHLQGVEVSNPGTGDHRRLDVGGVVLKLGREQRVDLVRGQLDLGVRGGIAVNARSTHFASADICCWGCGRGRVRAHRHGNGPGCARGPLDPRLS